MSYWIAMTACLLAIGAWTLRIVSSSLWLDETMTYWVVKDDFVTAINRAVVYQGPGPLHYALVWPFAHLFPNQEFALRAVSVICFCTLLFVLFRLARLLLGREGAVITLLLFLCGEAVLPTYANARAYSLGMFCITLCAYCVVMWVRTLRIPYLAGYFLMSLLSLYSHVLLLPVLLILFIYMCWYLARGTLLSGRVCMQIAFGTLVSLIIGLPSLYQLIMIHQKRGIMGFSEMPDLDALLAAWIPLRVVLSLLIASLPFIVLNRSGLKWTRSADHLGLLLGWHMFPPLCLYFVSVALGASVFNVRYFLWSAPATAILLAMILGNTLTGRARVLVLSLVVPALAYVETRHDIFIEHWSDATGWIESQAIGKGVPVLAATMIMESSDTSFLSGNESRDYVLCPFSFYHLSTHPILALPLWFDQPGAAEYLDKQIWPALATHDRIFLIARAVGMHAHPARSSPMVPSDRYLTDQLARRNWKKLRQEWFGSVTVMELQSAP